MFNYFLVFLNFFGYEEGKKISLQDGVAAAFYIIYYNLVHPWSAMRKNYIAEVNAALEAPHASRIASRNDT